MCKLLFTNYCHVHNIQCNYLWLWWNLLHYNWLNKRITIWDLTKVQGPLWLVMTYWTIICFFQGNGVIGSVSPVNLVWFYFKMTILPTNCQTTLFPQICRPLTRRSPHQQNFITGMIVGPVAPPQPAIGGRSSPTLGRHFWRFSSGIFVYDRTASFPPRKWIHDLHLNPMCTVKPVFFNFHEAS